MRSDSMELTAVPQLASTSSTGYSFPYLTQQQAFQNFVQLPGNFQLAADPAPFTTEIWPRLPQATCNFDSTSISILPHIFLGRLFLYYYKYPDPQEFLYPGEGKTNHFKRSVHKIS